MIFAFTVKDDMSFKEVKDECSSGWIPLLVYEFEGRKIIPVFKDINICRDFLKRNMPKGWLYGAVELNKSDIESIAERECKFFDWPNKIKDLVEFDIDIIETDGVNINVESLRKKCYA